MHTTLALRDRVIDWLALHAPQLLMDDRMTEGIMCLVVVEVRRGTEDPDDHYAVMRLADDGNPHATD